MDAAETRKRLTPHVFDIEIFKNYLLIGFKNVETGKVVSVESQDRLCQEDRDFLRSFMKARRTVGFNSRNFDIPILYAAIAGHSVRTLKKIADQIIFDGLRPWDIAREYDFFIPKELDHIDLIEVAPGKASLKIYNGRLHGRRMQDLPFDPDESLTEDEIEIVYTYWENDLESTELLLSSLKEQLALRTAMSKEYGEDLRSKSDAQIAEAVIKRALEDLNGEAPEKPGFSPGSRFKYRVPSFMKFRTAEMRELLEMVRDADFTVSGGGKVLIPKALTDRKIHIGNGIYRMGIGGLHSSESTASYVADEEYALFDRDVTSYYPAIIINQGLYPKQLGPSFLVVYKGIVDRRIAEKKAGNKVVADSLKITVNGSFGKFGNRYSTLYSPDLLIQTTVTGQLALLMKIERMEQAGIEVVSANTDGVVMRCRRDLISVMDDIVKEWERDTGYQTELTEYGALYSRDVNNYIAITTSGKDKTKGAYAPTGLQKNPQNEICVEAVIKFIKEGVPLRDTIYGCTDIRKFVTVRTVRGGATKDDRYLGKAIRWYYSTETETAIHYKLPNASGTFNKVPKSDKSAPLMELPDRFPPDVDHERYIAEANEILCDIAFKKRPPPPPKIRFRKPSRVVACALVLFE